MKNETFDDFIFFKMGKVISTERLGYKNAHIIKCENGEYLRSYETPVLARINGRIIASSSLHYSTTTTRQAGDYLRQLGYKFRKIDDIVDEVLPQH